MVASSWIEPPTLLLLRERRIQTEQAAFVPQLAAAFLACANRFVVQRCCPAQRIRLRFATIVDQRGLLANLSPA
jgi:hypothetical protein